VDPCKAEVFSIGLTLLSSATLENCNGFYDTQGGHKIEFDKINNLLRRLSQKYSPLLVQTISSMIAKTPENRKKASEIYQMLFPY
jgi:hypothetical protein